MTKKNESGQALIELIIFLPMMFTIYFLIAGFANSINGSINQQKITRAYFYYLLQNNSTLPQPDGNTHQAWGRFGMFFIGWREKFAEGSESPVMPCYEITFPMKAAANDHCEDKYKEDSSKFIRVGTVYGMCGTTYWTVGNIVHWAENYADFRAIVDPSSCLINR